MWSVPTLSTLIVSYLIIRLSSPVYTATLITSSLRSSAAARRKWYGDGSGEDTGQEPDHVTTSKDERR